MVKCEHGILLQLLFCVIYMPCKSDAAECAIFVTGDVSTRGI